MILSKLLVFILLILRGYCLNTSSALYLQQEELLANSSFEADYAHRIVNIITEGFRQWYFTIVYCNIDMMDNYLVKFMSQDSPVLLLDSCYCNSCDTPPITDRNGASTNVVAVNEISQNSGEYVVKALRKTRVWQHRRPVIVILNLPVVINSYFMYSVGWHFEYFISQGIFNSIVIVWAGDAKIFAYNRYLKRTIELTKQQANYEYIMDLHKNLYGKIVRVSALETTVDVENKDEEILCNHKWIVTFMNYFNGTCMIVGPRDHGYFGDVLENGTITGVTADLNSGYANIEYHKRILKNSNYGYIETTYPFSQEQLCFLVKKSGRQSTFYTTILLLSKHGLLDKVLIVILLIPLNKLVYKLEDYILNSRNGRQNAQLAVSCSINKRLFRPAYKVLLLITFTHALAIDAAIEALITSSLTSPRNHNEINSLDDIIASNLKIAVHYEEVKILLDSLQKEYRNIVKKRLVLMGQAELRNAWEQRKFEYAILMKKSSAINIRQHPKNVINGISLFHVTENCPVPCFTVFGLEKGSPYAVFLHAMVLLLNQAGVLNYWGSENNDKYLTHKIVWRQFKNKGTIKPISGTQLKEIYVIYFACIAMSVLGFIAEHFIVYFKRKLSRRT